MVGRGLAVPSQEPHPASAIRASVLGPGHCKRYWATGPELTDWLLPFKGTAGGDVSANKWTSKRNDAKPVISANTWHRATFWVNKYRH